jgi:membrane protease YdiL (CAAX protease family)
MTTNRQLLFYCGLIFFLSWTLQILAIATTGDIASESAELWLVATMFVPLVVTIAFLIKYKSLRSALLWKPNLKIFGTVVIAFLIPTVIAFLVLFFIEIMGYGHSGWFEFYADGVSISGGPFLLGLGKQSWLIFTINIIATAGAFSLMNGIPAAGEEFAWRGFLQGQLIQRFGTMKGIAILGFIWSMWHLPAQLAGYNFPDNPIFGSLIISPVELIAVSFFLGWLTLKSGSFIPAAIAHGAGNSIQEGVISNISIQVPRVYEDLITLLTTVVIGLVFLYLINKTSKAERPKEKVIKIEDQVTT